MAEGRVTRAWVTRRSSSDHSAAVAPAISGTKVIARGRSALRSGGGITGGMARWSGEVGEQPYQLRRVGGTLGRVLGEQPDHQVGEGLGDFRIVRRRSRGRIAQHPGDQ